MRLIIPFLLLFVFLFLSCDNAAPSSPDFLITSIEFTGDSTGNELEGRGSLSVPYCEFTIEWDAPSSDSRYDYTVFRSIEPDIQNNLENAEELTTLLNTSWVDSEELDWNAGYYYAVKAIPSLSGDIWSNEVFIQTPVSPFSTPGELSFERIHFRTCSLSWEACTGSGFQSAILMRSDHEDIEHCLSWRDMDTLLVTSNSAPGVLVDSSITGRDQFYYVLEVSAGEDILSYSNEVCFTPGADFPWVVDKSFHLGGALIDSNELIGLVSRDSARLYLQYGADYSGKDVLWCINASNGSSLGSTTFESIFGFTERADASILVTYKDGSDNYYMSNFSENFSSVLQTVNFNRAVSSVLETPAGILCTSANKSLLLDPVSFEILDSIPGTFTYGVSFDNLNRSFLMRPGGVKALRSSDLEYLGVIYGDFLNIQAGLDGNLYCFSETGVELYDAIDLSLQDNFTYPSNTLGAVVLPGNENIIYVYRRNDLRSSYTLEIYNMSSYEMIGTVQNLSFIGAENVFLFPSMNGEFLWYFLWDGLSSVDYFNVTL